MTRARPPLAAATIVLCLGLCATASAALRVDWMAGVRSPGTPARYDRVGIIRTGSPAARNVLVLEPGTLAGSTYFLPLARWIVSRAPGWQVWSIERRENLLEDQSVLDRAKAGHATALQLFDYYLGPPAAHHFRPVPDGRVAFAKRWGMAVAVGDLHRVIGAAARLGGKVVLGGHSLGGGVVTAYASWDFGGRPGADALSGLVFIDGGGFGSISAGAARAALAQLHRRTSSPWAAFGPIPAPFAGVFSAIGSTAALTDPNGRSPAQASGLLAPFRLTPSVPLTNLAQFGYALNVSTAPHGLEAAEAHLGAGIDSSGTVRGWNGAGALTPIRRYAQMFSGTGVAGADGTEWYFPERLSLDLGAVGEGTGGGAQGVLGLHAVLGRRLPRRLRIYAFGAALGGRTILGEARRLAAQSHIPASRVTLIDRHATYAHNDPNAAYPHNAFFTGLIGFLARVSRR